MAMPCILYRDGRNKPGHEVKVSGTSRMLPSTALFPLVVFMALLLAASLHALAAAGHFPRDSGDTPGSPAGLLILYGSLVVSLACLATGLVVAWQSVPWYAAVIGGGMVALFAPLLLRLFPDRFVDGAGALIAFVAAGAVLAVLLVAFG
jgi:hypothetical protein